MHEITVIMVRLFFSHSFFLTQSSEVVEQILHTVSKSSSLEELTLENVGLKAWVINLSIALFLLFITLTVLLSFFSSKSSFLVLSLSFFPLCRSQSYSPATSLPLYLISVPECSTLYCGSVSTHFLSVNLEISHRKWPLPCQKTQHQSYTPLTWPTIHWTTKVHSSKSLFFCCTSLSPPVCLFCLFLLSLYHHVHLLFLSLSGCFFVLFCSSCLCFADLLWLCLLCVCSAFSNVCVFVWFWINCTVKLPS